MAIPQYQEFMSPTLEVFADGKEKENSEVYQSIITKMNFSEDDLAELLPSGIQSVVRNRLNWAIYYMYRAGLLEKIKMGLYKISSSGKKALHDKKKINNDYLSQFETFRKFQEKSSKNDTTSKLSVIKQDQSQDPREKIETAIKEINEKIQTDILEQLKQVDPVHFERIVLGLMISMGYGGNRSDAAQMTKKSHDGGIDGIINEDKLGLDKIYLQAKRYTDGKVNSKEMQYFVGALKNNQSNKGIFITTSEFDSKAIEMAKNNNIITIDGYKLSQLMLDYNVGVICRSAIEIKELDLSYFSED
ncbi:MAG: restriction endonuclease [Endomicrobia bacterium]|nr:restriction endonuclease [Endomicrobiia bacterium]